MTAVSRRPARLSGALAVGAVGLSMAATGTAEAATLGAAGVAALGVGVLWGHRTAVTLGAWLALGGVFAAGLSGAGPAALLVGTAAAVLAWDLGEQAVNVGEQLGRAAPTRDAELVHAANSTLVAVVGVALGYGLFLVAAGGQPVTALVVLLGAGLALAATLGD